MVERETRGTGRVHTCDKTRYIKIKHLASIDVTLTSCVHIGSVECCYGNIFVSQEQTDVDDSIIRTMIVTRDLSHNKTIGLRSRDRKENGLTDSNSGNRVNTERGRRESISHITLITIQYNLKLRYSSWLNYENAWF